jgi:CcmD family protein
MIFATATLPDGSNDGYLAAAYIVFFVLVLVYVAIMAWRLTRVERRVRDLNAREREQEREERNLKGTPHVGRQAGDRV